MTGGELYISGPTSNGDGSIDCDGSATITGGIVVAAGSTGMAENFGNRLHPGQHPGQSLRLRRADHHLKDSDGNILASFTPAKAFGCVVVSAPRRGTGRYLYHRRGQRQTSVTMESLIYGSGMGGFGGMGGGMGDPAVWAAASSPAGFGNGRPWQPRLISIPPIKHLSHGRCFSL